MKITNEIVTQIKTALIKKGFKYKQSKGIDNYLNAAILEGIEMKEDDINPFAIGDNGDRIYGYSVVGNDTRKAVDIIEQIMQDTDIDAMCNTQNTEITPQPNTGIIPRYLTDEIIAKHPGTIPCLISMQVTDTNQIKTRPGQGGKMVQYVDTAYMTVALNYAALMDWSFEIIETRTDEIDKLLHMSVLGCLTINTTEGKTIQKQQWGSQVLKNKMEVGDALKAAGSDAMKKCASMLGIAADVYGGKA